MKKIIGMMVGVACAGLMGISYALPDKVVKVDDHTSYTGQYQGLEDAVADSKKGNGHGLLKAFLAAAVAAKLGATDHPDTTTAVAGLSPQVSDSIFDQ